MTNPEESTSNASNASTSQNAYNGSWFDDTVKEEDSQTFNLKQKYKELLEKTGVRDFSSLSVVSFLGLSQNETTTNVSSVANAIIEKNVFGQNKCIDNQCKYHPNKATLLIQNGKNSGLWMYCDLTKNTVYLLIDSINESETLLTLLEEVRPIINNELEIPSSYGPPNTGSGGVGVYGGRNGSTQGAIMSPGRCVPFLIFLFQEIQLSVTSNQDPNKSENNFDRTIPGNIKRIKEALQSRIRYLFRTCHLVQTSDLHATFDSRQLFTLPPPSSQFFVHLITRGSTGNFLSPNPSLALLTNIESTTFQENTNTTTTTLSIDALIKRRKAESRSAENFEIKLLKDFALGWFKWSVTGYPRSFVKRGLTFSELPNGKQWISGCIALKELLFGDFGKEILEKKSFNLIDDVIKRRLQDCLQINDRFSANHCAQALRKAIDIYLLESPTYYPQKYHKMKLEHAMQFYLASARGPCIQEYAQKLQIECQNIWERGRQKCEKKSLSGHECVLGANHYVDSDKKHRSAFQALQACNCGRSRRDREDPFDLLKANKLFFEFPGCCKSNGNGCFILPQVTNSTIISSMWSIIRLGSGSMYKPSAGLDNWDGFVTNANFLLPFDIPLIVNRPQFVQEELFRIKDANGWSMNVAGCDWAKLKKIKNKEEKLVNPTTRKGLKYKMKSDEVKIDGGSIWSAFNNNNENLPKWTSTSSSSSIFNLNDCLKFVRYAQLNSIEFVENQPTNTAATTSDSKEKRAAKRAAKINQKKERDKPSPLSLTQKEITAPVASSSSSSLKGDNLALKGYVGIEYECPLGHRFMSCGDRQIYKLGHSSHIKRVIIVTPDSSLSLTLKPMIKSTLNKQEVVSPLFDKNEYEQSFKGILLPKNSLIVLRLPYIHYNQSGEPIYKEQVIISSNSNNINNSSLTNLYLEKGFLFVDLPNPNLLSGKDETSSIT
ncbi:11097_t:CDS:10 [Entrophospora sp. SA101]|nr:11097_t:CDS:10 [Entrophospora sp. SA101]CAJ0846200.1 9392_t:CDS:10 [Entrophospora sp. SA101]